MGAARGLHAGARLAQSIHSDDDDVSVIVKAHELANDGAASRFSELAELLPELQESGEAAEILRAASHWPAFGNFIGILKEEISRSKQKKSIALHKAEAARLKEAKEKRRIKRERREEKERLAVEIAAQEGEEEEGYEDPVEFLRARRSGEPEP
jgi:hypothetical protein